jgi:hypothetical protein
LKAVEEKISQLEVSTEIATENEVALRKMSRATFAEEAEHRYQYLM